LAQGVAGVVFAGAARPQDLPGYYAAGDVFAMPCRSTRGGLEVEGLGIVYLEAAATGLPVIAGDSGGAPEAVRHGETGWVVPGVSVRETAHRILELLRNPEEAARMGIAGRRWVETSWTWDVTVARLAALLRADPAEPAPRWGSPGRYA
jgi:phosphatidylinositol alpha-1,6-mannosyltransferase